MGIFLRSPRIVTPAKAGVQTGTTRAARLDPGFRRGDAKKAAACNAVGLRYLRRIMPVEEECIVTGTPAPAAIAAPTLPAAKAAPILIEIDHLTKRFGTFTAVNDVSFTVKRGEVLGFLGPNGAGKSTTMRMLAGFMIPTSGSASILGHDVQTDAIAARRVLGFLPEGAPTYPEMTVSAFLRFTAKVRGYAGGELLDRLDHAIAMTGLDGVREQTVETLSKGFKRRVGLAQALLHDPAVLVLDEPTDGLDPNQKHEVRNLIARMAPQKAIVISTHILEEVDAVCTRAIIIARGKIVADGTPAELERMAPSGKLDDVFRDLTLKAA